MDPKYHLLVPSFCILDPVDCQTTILDCIPDNKSLDDGGEGNKSFLVFLTKLKYLYLSLKSIFLDLSISQEESESSR